MRVRGVLTWFRLTSSRYRVAAGEPDSRSTDLGHKARIGVAHAPTAPRLGAAQERRHAARAPWVLRAGLGTSDPAQDAPP